MSLALPARIRKGQTSRYYHDPIICPYQSAAAMPATRTAPVRIPGRSPELAAFARSDTRPSWSSAQRLIHFRPSLPERWIRTHHTILHYSQLHHSFGSKELVTFGLQERLINAPDFAFIMPRHLVDNEPQDVVDAERVVFHAKSTVTVALPVAFTAGNAATAAARAVSCVSSAAIC